MRWDRIERRLRRIAGAAKAAKPASIGRFEDRDPEIVDGPGGTVLLVSRPPLGPPAKERDIKVGEAELGAPLPASLREALLQLSGEIRVSWMLGWSLEESEQERLEDYERRVIASGGLRLSIGDIVEVQGRKQALLAGRGARLYGASWRSALAFMKLDGGDYLAIDVERGGDGPVVYLARGQDGDGVLLGASFGDFLERWSRLACVGPEYAATRHFLTERGLDPACPNAVAFRALLKLGELG